MRPIGDSGSPRECSTRRRSPLQHNGRDRHLQPGRPMRLMALMCCVLALWAAPPMRSGQTPAAQPARTARTADNAPNPEDIVAIQVALDRAGFSPGEIDGLAGRNMERALTAFQKEQRLPTT